MTSANSTTPQSAIVRNAFDDLCAHLAITDKATIEAEWQEIVTAHSKPHRSYHNLRHLEEMLYLLHEFEVPASELPRLHAFILYHDFYYETEPLDLFAKNEARSAERCTEFLRKSGADGAFIESVANLINATKTHKLDAAADLYGALGIDIDMAILASRAERYDEYAADVRREFGAYADDVFYPARLKQFLEPTEKSGRIFLTPHMHEEFNAIALGNIAREKEAIYTRFPLLRPKMA
ncbi:MAG: hypothetical protein KGQ41_05825 [Alphaproteobacteria bacterium]|nr:hypothetical protein [Alphaproteobacteria bacterium]